jgi:type IV pilus assembly protein PilA
VLNILRNRLKGEQGFTLIELLVVILIIGILAAIAIPSFLNQKGKGEDSAAKSAARNAQTAMETFYTDNGTYANATNATTGIQTIEQNLPPLGSGNGQLEVTGGTGGGASPTATQYRVTVRSNPSGRAFWVDKNGATISRGCSVPAGASNGGCNASSW